MPKYDFKCMDCRRWTVVFQHDSHDFVDTRYAKCGYCSSQNLDLVEYIAQTDEALEPVLDCLKIVETENGLVPVFFSDDDEISDEQRIIDLLHWN